MAEKYILALKTVYFSSELVKAALTKVTTQFGMEMAFGGAGEVYGTAWGLAQNRDKINEKFKEAKEKFQNLPKEYIDATRNPNRLHKWLDTSA